MVKMESGERKSEEQNRMESRAEKKVSLLTVAVATYVSLSVGVCESVLLAGA